MNFRISLIAVFAVSGILPLSAETVQLYDFIQDGWYFKKVSENTVELSPISYSRETPVSDPVYQGQNGEYRNFPPHITDNEGNYYEVVGIGAHAFEGSTVRGISVEPASSSYENFAYIGDFAFYGCEDLEYANIPSNVKTIGESAFDACSSLKHVALGFAGGNEWDRKEITIGINAFRNTHSLTEVFFNSGFDNITVQSNTENPNTFTICGSETSPTRFYCSYFPNETAYFNVGVDWVRYGSFNTPDIVYTGQEVTTPPMPVFKSNLLESSNITANIGQVYCNSGIKNVTQWNHEATAYVNFVIYNEFSFTVPLPYEFSIFPAPLTLKVADASREYGDPNPKFDFSFEGFVNGEDAEVLRGCSLGIADWTENFPTVSSPVGIYNIAGYINLTNTNYMLASTPYGRLTVTPALLTISAKSCSRQYGQDNPDVELEYFGFKNDETAEVLAKQPQIHIPAGKNSPVGEYPISVTGADAQNYSISYNPGILTVAKADQTIDWTQEFSDVEIGDDVDLTAGATSGLAIEYTSSNPEVAKIEGSIVKLLAEGSATITAYQRGDANYNEASPVEKEINVGKSTDIGTISYDGFRVTVEHNKIIIHTTDDNLEIRIYNMSGNIVYIGKERIISLPKGVYIVPISGKTYKIIL